MVDVVVVPIIYESIGTLSKCLQYYMGQIGAEIKLENLQNTTQLRTARILRKVLKKYSMSLQFTSSEQPET